MTSYKKTPLSRLRATAAGILAAALATPALSAVEDLRITEIDLSTGTVEVTNTSPDPVTLSANMPFCHRFDYSSSISGGTSFTGGESQTFSVSGLNATEGDLWLYDEGTGNFNNGSAIISGLQYGSNNGGSGWGRTGLASTVNKWTSSSDFVPLPASGETLQLNALETNDPANWVSQASTLNSFFGTGEEITNPLPDIATGSVTIGLQTIATGLTSPLGMAPLNDGTNRNLVYDQIGEVYLLDNDTLSGSPVLDVSSLLVTLGAFGPGTFDERGLLGVAVHPDFGSGTLNFYTYTSEPVNGTADFTVTTPLPGGTNMDHQAVIREWTVTSADPFTVDSGSSRELLRIDEPNFNHDGGTLRFGPDGMLYIALGDGGSADDQGDGHDPEGNAQNPENIYGTILRIDVDGTNSTNGEYGIPGDNPFVGSSGLDEIYAWGLRNPFSFSFDSSTGDLWLGDVGQNDVEEVHLAVAGGNHGWRLKEGSFFFDPNGTSSGFVTSVPTEPIPSGLVEPVAEYDHDDGLSVIGGFVYRGSNVPDLQGLYVTGDFGFSATSGRLFYMDPAASTPTLLELQLASPPFDHALKGFGQSENDELYVFASQSTTPDGSTGKIFKITSATTSVDNWMIW